LARVNHRKKVDPSMVRVVKPVAQSGISMRRRLYPKKRELDSPHATRPGGGKETRANVRKWGNEE